jgi:phage/plasmid-associated DNA primase
MNQSLTSLLRHVGTPSGPSQYTHEIIHTNKSQWRVNDNAYGELLKGYCSMVSDQDGGELALAERPREVMPLIVQLSLIFDHNGFKEPYDDVFIYTFAWHCQQTILKNLQVDDDSNDLTCVILESEVSMDDKNQSRCQIDLRFHFPYCRVDASTQKKTLYPHLIRRLRAENVSSKFFHQPIGDWETIIDQDVVTNPLPMYYSSLRLGSRQMVLSKIVGPIDHDAIEDHDTDEMDVKLEDIFSPAGHSYVFRGLVSGDIFNERDCEFWLPIFLSVDYWHKQILPKQTSRNTPARPGMYDSNHTVGYDLSAFGVGESPSDKMGKMELAEIFVRMWKVERILSRSYWLDIGEAFFDADEGDDAGFRAWIDVTERALQTGHAVPDFLISGAEASCGFYYHTFRTGRVDIKTLAKHASEDNKKSYDTWHKAWCMKAMECAVERQTHVAVAKALCRLNWLDFICTHEGGGKRVTWYQFVRHRWMMNPGGYALSRTISNEFISKFEDMRIEIAQQGRESRNSQEKTSSEKIITKIGVLIKLLENQGFKSSVMSAATEILVHDDLDSLMDDNGEILGLPNGVIVATRYGIEVRNGRPQDYITRTTNVPYRRDFSWAHPTVIKVMEWMHQIFVDEELFHYFMKWAASTLRGGNKDKHLSVWTGQGDNSKSMLVKLFECVYGSYCIKMPIGLAANGGRGNNANNASPAIARSRATRLCFMEEPGRNMQFDSDMFKHLTGSDKFFARLLKKNGGDIKPLFKLIMMCNDVPSIPRDRAMENRLKIIAFLQTWVDDPIAAEAAYQALYGEPSGGRFFQLDTGFEDEIPGMASAFLWVMVEYYPVYLKEGIRKTPSIIQQDTKRYWEDNDTYLQYAAECIEVAIKDGVQDRASVLDVHQLYTSFCLWHRTSLPGHKLPIKNTFRKELTSRWNKPINGAWGGIRFKTSNPIAPPGMGGRSALRMVA